jgi:hypothetical protein
MATDYVFADRKDAQDTFSRLGLVVSNKGYVFIADEKQRFKITPPYPFGTVGFYSGDKLTIFRSLTHQNARRAIENLDRELGITPGVM